MSIHVICSSCHARFSVSDKFAGQTGPCPKCKQPIRVPEKSEEVVIHGGEDYGPKDAAGRPVLKPLERQETKITAVGMVGIVAACLVTLLVAIMLGLSYRGSETGVPPVILGIGAVLLGPPLALAGYSLLRDSELEPHRGMALLLRCLVCGLIFAALWGVYAYLKGSLLDGQVELFHLAFLAPAMVAAGGVAALACLELDFTSGALAYGLYLFVTILLRAAMWLPPY